MKDVIAGHLIDSLVRHVRLKLLDFHTRSTCLVTMYVLWQQTTMTLFSYLAFCQGFTSREERFYYFCSCICVLL